jgi:predicted O-methyltransferase YrrM
VWSPPRAGDPRPAPAIVPEVIVHDAVREYIAAGLRHSDPVLREMEDQGAREGIPIVVPETGAFLHVLALASGARRVLEVGTAIGVSTLYLARALPEGGLVVSFEIDEERQRAARDYLERAGLAERVDLRLKDAREGLRELEGEFDMAFLDGVKAQYGDYFDLTLPLLRPGGLLAVDNVLRRGRVAEGRGDESLSDEQVATLRAFNQRLLEHRELVATITPVGDGVLIAVKGRSQ